MAKKTDDRYDHAKFKTPLNVGDEVIVGKYINANWREKGLQGNIKYGRILKAHLFGANAITTITFNNPVITSIGFNQPDYYECEVLALDHKTNKMKFKKIKVEMLDIMAFSHGLFTKLGL